MLSSASGYLGTEVKPCEPTPFRPFDIPPLSPACHPSCCLCWGGQQSVSSHFFSTLHSCSLVYLLMYEYLHQHIQDDIKRAMLNDLSSAGS